MRTPISKAGENQIRSVVQKSRGMGPEQPPLNATYANAQLCDPGCEKRVTDELSEQRALVRDPSSTGMVQFEVRGMPQTQGSMRAFVPKGWKRAIVTHVKGEKLKSWRGLIMDEAQKVAPAQPLEGALGIYVVFRLPRPRGHFGTGRNSGKLKACAPMHPAGKPDTDKLMRALGDAIKGVIYRDDSQLVEIFAKKEYGTPGAIVEVFPLEPL